MPKNQFTIDDFALISGEQLPTAQIGPWRMKGFREQTLRYLFGEVFLDSCYSCVLDTDSPVILDCGANIGFATLYFKHCWPGAVIHAFEPAPDSFSLLEQNVQANQLQSVFLHDVVLGLDAGSTQLYCEIGKKGSLRASILEDRLPLETTVAITVPVEPLSKFVNRRVDLLKLDIEGSEDEVIQELETSGKISQIQTAIIEYHWSPQRDAKYKRMKHTLVRSGFYLTERPGDLKEGYRDILLFAERTLRP